MLAEVKVVIATSGHTKVAVILAFELVMRVLLETKSSAVVVVAKSV